MVFIYSDKVSPRLTYTVSIVFDLLYSIPYTLTDNLDEFKAHKGPKFSYGQTQVNDIPWIKSSGLLDEDHIYDLKPEHGEHLGLTHLFPTSESLLPYDVFSSVFYIITRYEEYKDFAADEHGRYPLKLCISYQLGFYKKAIIHHWCKQLADVFNKIYPDAFIETKEFSLEVGLDIDNAFAIKHKGLLRTVGGIIKSLIKPNELMMRLSVLMGSSRDPYDNFQFIKDVISRFDTSLKIFFLSGKYGAMDKNISPQSKVFRELVNEFMKCGEIGIHPSYDSNKEDTLKDEIMCLERVSGKKITLSRQHYLKMEMPKTYRNLIEAEIKHDYSMGFAEDSGFRAGLALPYPFFDIEANKTSDLIIHPFFFMEATYVHYHKFNFASVKSELMEIMNEVRSVNGIFHAVWHNEYFGGENGEKWKDLFLFMLQKGSSK